MEVEADVSDGDVFPVPMAIESNITTDGSEEGYGLQRGFWA